MIEFLKNKIGSVLSAILFGDIKDLVIRTDEAVKRIDRDFDNVKEDINKIREGVGDIRPKVDLLWERAKGAVANGFSPRQLNEEGKRIFDQSEIKKVIDDRLNNLIDKIEKLNPETPYDIEHLAEQVMYGLKTDSSLIDFLKNGAYETGSNIDTILFVGSIYLRDKYLERHPELSKR